MMPFCPELHIWVKTWSVPFVTCPPLRNAAVLRDICRHFFSPFFLKWTSSKRTLCRMGQRDENAFVHQHVSLGSAKIECWPVQKREHEFEYSYSCLVVGWKPFLVSFIATGIIQGMAVHVCSFETHGELPSRGWAASLRRVSQRPHQFKNSEKMYWEAIFGKWVNLSSCPWTLKNRNTVLVLPDSWNGFQSPLPILLPLFFFFFLFLWNPGHCQYWLFSILTPFPLHWKK